MNELRERLLPIFSTGSAEKLAAALAVVHKISSNPENGEPGSALQVEPGFSFSNENKKPAAS